MAPPLTERNPAGSRNRETTVVRRVRTDDVDEHDQARRSVRPRHRPSDEVPLGVQPDPDDIPRKEESRRGRGDQLGVLILFPSPERKAARDTGKVRRGSFPEPATPRAKAPGALVALRHAPPAQIVLGLVELPGRRHREQPAYRPRRGAAPHRRFPAGSGLAPADPRSGAPWRTIAVALPSRSTGTAAPALHERTAPADGAGAGFWRMPLVAPRTRAGPL